MEEPINKRDIATIEYVEPKIKSFTFTSTILGVKLYNHIMRFDNCIFVVISQDNTFSCLSVVMPRRNSIKTIVTSIFNRDPDDQSQTIANLLIKGLNISVPLYVSFNANIEVFGFKYVISSLIDNFKSHPELMDFSI